MASNPNTGFSLSRIERFTLQKMLLLFATTGLNLLAAPSIATPSLTRPPAGPVISPYLVGNNVWYKPTDQVWEVSSKAGLQLIRIGGIEYDNKFPSEAQLTDWVNRIKAMGAEPMIQVSSKGTPAQAAAVVRYLNLKTKNKVKFWNIGNEPWIERGQPKDRMSLAPIVAGFVKSIALAMKKVDPSIKIYAPDECDYMDEVYDSLLGGSFDITGKAPNGLYYIDGVSWHRYVGYPPQKIQISGLTTQGTEDYRERMEKTRKRVDYVNKLHGRRGRNALQWGIGEFNASDGSRACTFENGQMFGRVYGYVMKYGGTYAATWSMFESEGKCSGTDFGFIGADMKPRSSYYHLQMVAQNLSGIYVEGSSSVPGVQAYAGVDKDKIAVMLLNIETSGQRTCSIRLNSDAITGGDCLINLPANIPSSTTQAIGSETTMLLVFNLEGQLIKRITYSRAKNWEVGAPPTVEILDPRANASAPPAASQP